MNNQFESQKELVTETFGCMVYPQHCPYIKLHSHSDGQIPKMNIHSVLVTREIKFP